MVRNTISYAGDVILTIYHKGFDEEIGYRKIKRTKKIGRYNIVFEEEVVEDTVIDNLTGWDWKIEGLLSPKDIRNPYHEAACAYMVQYVYLNKPRRLFSLREDGYCLNISDEFFEQIILFTKKYTGLNLKSQALCYGNVFVYECYQRIYCAKNGNGIIIDEVPENASIIINFKKDDMVVCTKIITKARNNMQIVPDCEWNSFDIQIYVNNKLVYYDQNVSFIETLILNSTIKGNNKKIQLEKLGNDFVIEGKGLVSTSVIGKKQDELKLLITKSNYSIKQRLVEEQDESNFLFIIPNQLDKARACITEILFSDCDEIWVFDPYFSDRSGRLYSLDWIRILAYSSAAAKNIVFSNKENNENNEKSIENKFMTVDEFVKLISDDRAIKDAKGRRGILGINFYQIETYIHDRFIFALKGEMVKGIAIGTSLNSLDRNYYCIHKLSKVASRKVFNELRRLVAGSNILAKDGI